MKKYEYLLNEVHGSVALIRLNRPAQLNALCAKMISELSAAIESCERNDEIGAIVLTGDAKAFAAGADIREMAAIDSFLGAYLDDFSGGDWSRLSRCRKPVIAAVAGYALGGGCELALMCDFILAADTAQFGQLEITLGIIPGTGGTQRLARFIGKSKAMEMCMSGRLMDAAEAERCGLASRIVPADDLVAEAIKTASRIAALSRPAVMMVKECVNRGYETSMAEGLLFERRQLHASFSLNDRKEGMNAFLEKRTPHFADGRGTQSRRSADSRDRSQPD